MERTQEHRAVAIATPLGKDVLLFFRMTATESLGRLFEFQIDLLSQDPNIRFDDILGQKVTVRLDLGRGRQRYFSGHVSNFTQGGTVGDLYAYHATVRPWLWFLTLTANCRIFQEKKTPDIIKEVFKDQGFTDYEEALSGSYQPWEYCVQYRETDFNFVSRLMEHEGIYYYFKHENDKHTLVLSDSTSSHQPFPGYERLPFYPRDTAQRRERDHIFDWHISQEVQPGVCALNDFHFKTPKANLHAKSAIKHSHAVSDMEVYDYPGIYLESGEGEKYARVRIEERQCDHELVHSEGNARGLSVGYLFELTGFARKDQNREYLIVSAKHDIVSDLYETGKTRDEVDIYACSFTAMPSQKPFRPARITPKPVVRGPQTAVVVGPAGSEIYTDKYSRVKLKFHWDRYSKADEKSSCWVRVSQLWAGAKWGAIHIPRIGQEVIVDFLEGDPDRPIITGRVYNDDNMPPYDLPDNATQSGIKSRSSKGGSPTNITELRFEDKKGEELIFLQAEKDLESRVKHDLVELVGNEDHLTVKSDQFQLIKGDKNLAVKGDRNEKVEGTISREAGMNIQEKAGLRHALDAGMEIYLKAGMNIVLEAGMSITLKAGGGFVVVGPAGVTISGTPVLINSGGAAGSGSGCSPQPPKAPREPGESSAVKKETAPPVAPAPSPKSHAFKSAAVSGIAFLQLM
ncbi:MAG TPA: type VI secretion system tip protein VgrG [Syntrophobacteraceae bacterium]|nr:type VI secretion system tip protein VgrG [Syntrophobacteraceae bacterium]